MVVPNMVVARAEIWKICEHTSGFNDGSTYIFTKNDPSYDKAIGFTTTLPNGWKRFVAFRKEDIERGYVEERAHFNGRFMIVEVKN